MINKLIVCSKKKQNARLRAHAQEQNTSGLFSTNESATPGSWATRKPASVDIWSSMSKQKKPPMAANIKVQRQRIAPMDIDGLQRTEHKRYAGQLEPTPLRMMMMRINSAMDVDDDADDEEDD